jgi:hypothetical protein
LQPALLRGRTRTDSTYKRGQSGEQVNQPRPVSANSRKKR